MADEEAPEVIEVGKEGIHHLEPTGVTSGLNTIPFHWINRTTGKAVPMGKMHALGRRNLEFRREEAAKAGYDFAECGPNCPHCEC